MTDGAAKAETALLESASIAMRAPPGRGGDYWLAGIAAVLVLAFCVLPLLRLLAEAVLPASDRSWPLAALASPSVLKAGINTMISSLAATAVALILGGGLALTIGLTDVRRKGTLIMLSMLPLLIPSQISALEWIKMLDAGAPVRNLLEAAFGPLKGHPLYGAAGVSWVMGLEHTPLVFLSVAAAVRGLPCDLIEAARSAGARNFRIFRTIILPLLGPAIMAGGTLAFVSAIGNFGVPALLGIPGRFTVLTTLIYQRLSGFGPSILGETAALGLVLTLLAGIGLMLQRFALRRAPLLRRVGPTGPILQLGRARLPTELVLWLVLLMLTVVPLASLVGAALVPALGVPLTFKTATLQNFAYVLFDYAPTRRAFLNSTLLSAAAALVTALLAVVLAYYAEARHWRWMRRLDAAADAPYAVPGTVLAIAIILIFLKPLPLIGVSLYGTAWIVLVSYISRFLALTLRPLTGAMRQLDPTLEEAAQLAGAGGPQRLATIVLPSLRAAVMSGAVLVFLTAFNELTLSALLWSQGHETLGVMVFSLQNEGSGGNAAAVASLAVIVTLALAAIATLCARRLPRGTLPWIP
jgi:iron(III) transport system permease protein